MWSFKKFSDTWSVVIEASFQLVVSVALGSLILLFSQILAKSGIVVYFVAPLGLPGNPGGLLNIYPMQHIKIEIKWALIFIVVALLWMGLERLAGLHSEHIDKHAVYTNFFAVPAIAVYVFALLDKRRNYYNGIMSYKQGFISGLVITGIVTVLSPITQYTSTTLVSPGYFDAVTKYVVEKGSMSPAQARDYFNLRNYIVQSLIGTAVMGIITTAIIALFTRKKKQASLG